MEVFGIDNNLRAYFFGADGSTMERGTVQASLPRYTHKDFDIRSRTTVKLI